MRLKMKRRLHIAIVCLLMLFSFSVPAFAANQVNNIDIKAVVNNDGSMVVTQTWKGSFDEGTENFIPMKASDYLTISDLKVKDQNGTYETLPEWNIDADLEEKANTCGILETDEGYEICFGISEYGDNTYTIKYKLDNLVGGYTDMDGVNFKYVNDQMTTTPTDVTLDISLADGTPLTDDIADIWAFGFEGDVKFNDGSIKASTKKPIEEENHVTVMFGIKKGVLSPARTEDTSFETVKEAAFEGSDYDTEDGGLSTFAAGVIVALIILIPMVVMFFVRKLKKKRKRAKLNKFSDQFGYFRDLPNDGNTNATYALGRLFDVCKDGAILSTGMLRLIDLRCLEPMTEDEVGFMGKTKEVVNLKMLETHHGDMNEYDEYLYTVLEGAAGSDGILQSNELEEFAEENDHLLRNYINKCDSQGRAYLDEKDCLNRPDIPSKLKYLTQSGKKELGELMGFKKYLEEFSLIAERSVKEIPIWKEMLSYAMLFGIADKVAEQMKELYPNMAVEVTNYNNSLYTAYSYQYLLYKNMRRSEERREQEERSSGGGGFSSLGGGGGSIGGGSGGGSR